MTKKYIPIPTELRVPGVYRIPQSVEEALGSSFSGLFRDSPEQFPDGLCTWQAPDQQLWVGIADHWAGMWYFPLHPEGILLEEIINGEEFDEEQQR